MASRIGTERLLASVFRQVVQNVKVVFRGEGTSEIQQFAPIIEGKIASSVQNRKDSFGLRNFFLGGEDEDDSDTPDGPIDD